jgi:hypothetical protein
MTYGVPEGSVDLEYAKKAGVYVPNKGGVTTWFNGDIYSTKLTGQQTAGQIWSGRGDCAAGRRSTAAHPRTHRRDVLRGQWRAGVPRRRQDVHRVDRCCGVPTARQRAPLLQPRHPARQARVHLHPGGAEGMFVEGGDIPQPGVQVLPWGPERIDERMLALLAKYDTGLPPQ